MARRSKRLHAVPSNGEKKQAEKRYQAAIYARLSADQGAEMSGSVEVQIHMAKRFIENWNINHADKIDLIDHYVDLGKTGTNFNRSAFHRLLQDVRQGDINCIIVKDLSRFGRNYLEAGEYLEKIFPFLGVRFVAISDGFDTAAEGNDSKQMTAEIKNLVNDMYAKDFSRKAKLHLQQRRDDGSYVGGPPPYGYKAGWEGSIRKLVPDENTAEIVRQIYASFIKTRSYQAVADDLNRKNINPPAVYKKTGVVYCPPDISYHGWERSSVERILKSEIYIGTLVQGKTSIVMRNEKNRIHNDKAEWTVKEQAHEPLVDLALFEQAAEIRRLIRKKVTKHPVRENIFDGVLACGVCGKKLTRTGESYLCGDSFATKVAVCSVPNRVAKREVAGILYELLKIEFAVKQNAQSDWMEKGRAYITQIKAKQEQKLRLLESSVIRLNEEEGRKYRNYHSGSLLPDDFISYKRQNEKRLQELIKQKEDRRKEKNQLALNGEAYLGTIHSQLMWETKAAITQELVTALIEKIYVYPGKRMEVIFSYRDIPIERAVQS